MQHRTSHRSQKVVLFLPKLSTPIVTRFNAPCLEKPECIWVTCQIGIVENNVTLLWVILGGPFLLRIFYDSIVVFPAVAICSNSAGTGTMWKLHCAVGVQQLVVSWAANPLLWTNCCNLSAERNREQTPEYFQWMHGVLYRGSCNLETRLSSNFPTRCSGTIQCLISSSLPLVEEERSLCYYYFLDVCT